jgi:hypothetical protein
LTNQIATIKHYWNRETRKIVNELGEPVLIDGTEREFPTLATAQEFYAQNELWQVRLVLAGEFDAENAL